MTSDLSLIVLYTKSNSGSNEKLPARGTEYDTPEITGIKNLEKQFIAFLAVLAHEGAERFHGGGLSAAPAVAAHTSNAAIVRILRK